MYWEVYEIHTEVVGKMEKENNLHEHICCSLFSVASDEA